jgi:ribosomal protein S18 acetylase RimI-like enzyme
MIYRKMVKSDYDGVYKLWISCTGMGLNTIDDSKAGIEKFLDKNPDTCFVCEDFGEIIGVIMAGNDGRRGYIYHTAVKEERRRKSIGRNLVNSVLKELDNLGITKVALIAFSKNEIGNLFWENMGFTKREDVVYRNKSIKELTRIDT